jgi:hypothetical protein
MTRQSNLEILLVNFKKPPRSFYLGWLLGALLIAIPGWLGWLDKAPINLDLMFLVMGLAIGISQWLLLRRRLARANWWIAASVLGWGDWA